MFPKVSRKISTVKTHLVSTFLQRNILTIVERDILQYILQLKKERPISAEVRYYARQSPVYDPLPSGSGDHSTARRDCPVFLIDILNDFQNPFSRFF